MTTRRIKIFRLNIESIFGMSSHPSRHHLLHLWEHSEVENLVIVFTTLFVIFFCHFASILRLKILPQFYLHFFWLCINSFDLLVTDDVSYLRWCARSVERMLSLVGESYKIILLNHLFYCYDQAPISCKTKLQGLDYWLIKWRTKKLSATWWGRGISCSRPCSGCPGCCNPGVKCYFYRCFAWMICFLC